MIKINKPIKVGEVFGYKTCPSWLKLKYRERVNFCCEECGKHEKEVNKLQPHRIFRGCCGGLYTVCQINHPQNNVKSVCSDCHKKYHQNEN